MRPRGSEGDHLGIDAVPRQHVGAVGDVAMPANGDVVVARIVHAGISRLVHRDAHDTIGVAKRVEIFGRVKVVVNVDHHGNVGEDKVRYTTSSPRVALRRDQRRNTGQPMRTRTSPVRLSNGAAAI